MATSRNPRVRVRRRSADAFTIDTGAAVIRSSVLNFHPLAAAEDSVVGGRRRSGRRTWGRTCRSNWRGSRLWAQDLHLDHLIDCGFDLAGRQIDGRGDCVGILAVREFRAYLVDELQAAPVGCGTNFHTRLNITSYGRTP